MKKRISFVAGCALAAVVLAGCGTRKHWTEDVQLEDGSLLRIAREVTFNESDAWGGGAYNAVDSASTLRFTGELSSLPAWSVPLIAHTLYRDATTQEWVVVAITSSCDVWRKRGKPNPPYWEYHLRNGAWAETPLSQASIGRRSNLLRRYQQDLPSEHLTIAQKDLLQKDIQRLETMSYPERTFRVIEQAFTSGLGFCSQ